MSSMENETSLLASGDPARAVGQLGSISPARTGVRNTNLRTILLDGPSSSIVRKLVFLTIISNHLFQ
jgi:hypothetical protein